MPFLILASTLRLKNFFPPRTLRSLRCEKLLIILIKQDYKKFINQE